MTTLQQRGLEPTEHTPHPRNAMKFLWGGLGGLTPVIASLLILDHEIITIYLAEPRGSEAEIYKLVGYSVRVIGLFLIGGIWAYLHRAEKVPINLFQLGIVAPAMLTGMIHASNAQVERHLRPTEQRIGFSITIISPAYAQVDPKQTSKPSPADDLIKGILGRP